MANIREVSEQLKIHINTIRQWEKIFDLEIPRDSKNCRIYDESLINIFKQIKAQRDEGKELSGINVSLTSGSYEPNISLTLASHEANNQANMSLTEEIKNEVLKIITDQTELSEKYAKATYQIGKLEAQLYAAEEKIKLLPAPEEINQLKKELISLKIKNESLEKENVILKIPFWKKIFLNLQYKQA